ncbi:MAG: IPT/TIG domain-containing protein [Bacteroidota bacterium]|nr:IPT/TIG domain-containing protein [Bacteroidota bacterium]
MHPFFSKPTLILLLFTTAILNSCSKGAGNGSTPTKDPGITALNVTAGAYYTFVTINGNGFGSEISNVKVFFNDKPAIVIQVNPTSIKTAVPLDAGTGIVSVTVNGTKLNGPVFTYKKANIIYTLAGTAPLGFVNGPGQSAEFHAAVGIVVDKANNIYVADDHNNAVRKITPDGEVSTYATFDFIKVIAIDNADNLYISNGSDIRMITSSGQISTISYVNGVGSGAGLQFTGMAIDNNGIIYFSDGYNYRILKIGLDGVLVPFVGSLQPGSSDGKGIAATFAQPSGMVCDKTGNIFICDRPNLIRKITPDGMVTTYAGGKLGLVDGVGNGAGFNLPQSITIDDAGNLYVADKGNDAIRKIDINRNVTTLIGPDAIHHVLDGEISKAYEAGPLCITIGKDGRLYIGDEYGTFIRSIEFR